LEVEVAGGGGENLGVFNPPVPPELCMGALPLR
jgi:hypothetical protein